LAAQIKLGCVLVRPGYTSPETLQTNRLCICGIYSDSRHYIAYL